MNPWTRWAIVAATSLVAIGCSPRPPSAGPSPEPTQAPTAALGPTDAPKTGTSAEWMAKAGASPLVLLTPEEGAGAHPRLEWQPLPGATRYALVVFENDGGAYWAWSGAETAVYLGGGSEPPPDDRAGPILLRPMVWSVLAFDAGGSIIGYSESRRMAP